MRKIDKTCDLSKVYKDWENGLEAAGEPHPKYNSSNGEYYRDVVMQLHRCQKGLCAYTEKSLCKSSHFEEENWKDGRYIHPLPHTDRHGSLDHFDPELKVAKGWSWDNFFMIDYETNSTVVKGRKQVHSIFKPDRDAYDPFQCLDYSTEEHIFIPKYDLSENDKRQIETMLSTLGINHIAHTRRIYLRPHFSNIRYGLATWSETSKVIVQFPTAFQFCKQKFEAGEVEWDELLAN